MSDMTGAQLRETVEKLKEISDKIDLAEAEVKILNKQYEEVAQKILAYLQTTGQNSVKIDGVFNCIQVTDFYFSQPQSQEDVKNFNEWLKQEGLEDLRKVNSQTLNAELNRRRKKAEQDEELFMPPPGIEAPMVRHKLRANKA